MHLAHINERVRNRFSGITKEELGAVASRIHSLVSKMEQAGFADRHFESEFLGIDDAKFDERCWELWCFSQIAQLSPEPPKNGGPDFQGLLSGEPVSVEVTMVSPGKGLDRVVIPEVKPGKVVTRWLDPEAYFLRVANAFAKKATTQLVDASRINVLAINACRLDMSPSGPNGLPTVVNYLLGIGPLEVVVDKELLEPKATRYQLKNQYQKASGSIVDSAPFVKEAFEHISAVYWSERHPVCLMMGWVTEAHMPVIVHNPSALLSVPGELFPSARGLHFHDQGDFWDPYWIEPVS